MASRRSPDPEKQSSPERQVSTWDAQTLTGDIEIAAQDWVSFLESFSRQHENWLAGISTAAGEGVKVSNWRLQDITLGRAAGGDRILISLARNHGDHWIHEVKHPVQLIFKRDATGAHEGLDVISGDGLVTRLRFRGAARPETLDGVLPEKRPPRRAG